MNIRIPQSGNAARIAKAYLQSLGLALTHQQSLELVARLHGYQSWQAMAADKRFENRPVLKAVSSDEFELVANEPSAWVTVDNISVYIRRNDEGVSVDLFPKGHENMESPAGTWLTFDEATLDEASQESCALKVWVLRDPQADTWFGSLSPVPQAGSPGQKHAPVGPSGRWFGPFDEVLDLVEALTEELDEPFELNWVHPNAPLQAVCHVFQDNGDVELGLSRQEALAKARAMRDSGAGGTWTVETEGGELIAIFH